MSEADIRRPVGPAIVLHYLIAVVAVAAALIVTLLLEPNALRSPLFLLAIILSAWFGGLGPGLFSALLSTLCLDYFFLPPARSFKFDLTQYPQLIVFFISAVLVSSWSVVRRRAEILLRKARDEQEAKVQERTADLQRANEKLQAEIAERRRVEETLKQRADLLDLTHDTIFARDMNDVIAYWNRGAAELYGWSSDEAIGKVSHELMDTSFPIPLEEINDTLLRTGRWEGELIHGTRDGTKVVVASRWSLQRNDSGEPAAILETNNNVSEQKRAHEVLQETQAELAHVARVTTMGEIASSIAHEVNQPLAAIVMSGNACLRWLSGSPPNIDEAKQSVTRVVKDGHRASEVVGRIRTFFKKTAPHRAELDLNDLIEEVILILDGELRRNRVRVRTELNVDLPRVISDRIQLQQVLVNVIINANEAMSAVDGRRELVIKSQKSEPDSVHVTVQDTGPGLDAQALAKLFDAFYTTKSNGLGMGLSICKTVIEAHGGRLWATNSESGGAMFQFTLPIRSL